MLRFMDSFDHYTSISQKYTVSGGTISAGNGRNGTAAFYNSANHGAGPEIVLDAQATWIVGAAYKNEIPSATRGIFFALYDGTTCHVTVGTQADGKLVVIRGLDGGTLLATSTQTISANVWYHIVVYITIHDTAGVVKVWINGVQETLTFVTGTETTQDTRNAGNASANTIALHSSNSTSSIGYKDDLYICDGVDGTSTQGAANNDNLGDLRVEALFPSGNGATSQWLGSDGNNTDNYLLVDESAPNSDTDYVAELTSGDTDTYAMTNLTPTSGTIYGLQTLLFARKDDAGTRLIAPVLRISSTDYPGSSVSLSDTYYYHRSIVGKSPASGVPFTVSEVNGLEFGPKIP